LAFNKTGLSELAQPGSIGEIGLATRHLLDVAGVDEHQIEVVLEDVPDRLPIHTGGLHHDPRNAVRGQPVAQRQQPPHRGLKLGQVRLTATARRGHTHTRGHLRLVDIKRRRTLNDHLHHDLLATRTGTPSARASKTTSLRNVLWRRQSGIPEEAPTPN